ncbi:MAG: ABC transporter substrate-binding protein [Thermaerobacterales bacterium]
MTGILQRRPWLAVSLLMIIALLAAACGQAAPEPAAPSDSGSGGAATEPAADEGPFKVVVAQAADAASWDPPQDWNTAPEWLISNAYDCLLFKSPDSGSFEPKLATSWEQIDDLTFRVHLREGVKFHDGTELTAEDVKFHYERIAEGPRELYIVTDQYKFFDEIVIHDDYTFDFVTPAPDSLLLQKLSQTACGIVSKDYVEEVGPDGVHREPMGTGAYKLVEWVRGEHVTFEANEDWWGGKPDVDEFEFRIIEEASTRVAELLTGGVDLTYGILPQDEDRLNAKDNLSTVWSPTDRGYQLYTRIEVHPDYVGDPELDREFATFDPRVREAIELAIDKYALRDIAGGEGEAFRARLFKPLPEAHPDLYGPQANLYDPDRARAILQEAGYGDGEPTLVFHASAAWPGEDIALAVGDMLEQVGFNVDLRILDTTTFNQEIYFPRRTQELVLLGLGGQMNPFFALFSFRCVQTAGNYGYCNEELDPLIESAWEEVHDDARRYEMYQEASYIIAEDRPVIGLFQTSQLWGINDRIEYTPRTDNHIFGAEIKRAR